MPSPPPPIISLCLPALSVVLGLPLFAAYQHQHNGHGHDDDEQRNHQHDKESATLLSTHSAENTNSNNATTSKTGHANQDERAAFSRRVQGNISRIYARRIINKARLERQHPWSRTGAQKEEYNITPTTLQMSTSVGDKPTETTSTTTANSNPSSTSSWKNALLTETLLSLLKLQEKIEKIQSLANLHHSCHSGRRYFNNNIDDKWLLDLPSQQQLIQSPMMNIRLNSSRGSNTNNNGMRMVAQCEESSSNNNPKQRVLDKYNELHRSSTVMTSGSSGGSGGFWGNRSKRGTNDAGSNNNNSNKEKPAEWNEDIDLVQKRHEFGQQISPLSHTTRLQRWGMALKRIATLSMLVAPLGILVPMNYVVGNVVAAAGGGSGTRRGTSDDDDDDDGGEEVSMSAIEAKRGESTNDTNKKAEEGGTDEGRQREKEIAHASPKGSTALQQYHERLSTLTWDYALWAIETAGPTYIKLVQWASTRHDLFSPEFVSHFTKLQDETRGHSWKETEMALVRSFGKDWKNVLSFDKVIDDGICMDAGEDGAIGDGIEGGRLKRTGGAANRERQKRLFSSTSATTTTSAAASSSSVPTIPIGSGCVAQVYKARLTTHHGLHPPGTSVAVKVQHPRILEKVCLDFYILNKVASFLEYIPYLNLDYLSMKDSVDQFRDIMLPQLDLRVEAHNLQRFRRDFDGATQIAFPEPFLGLTTREVLVERFVEGEPMLNFVLKEDEHHSKKDRQELATIGLETVMKMIFLHDFVHADLHPGNMIVDRNKNARGNPLRVHMIDCGLTVELGERDHKNLVKILGSLIKRDGYAAGALMVDTAKKCQATELDVELFCKGIEKICLDDEDNNFLESVGDYITDICYLACKHKVKLEAAFINAALACEIMEGLASSLYPDMQVQTVALPMVLKAEMMHGLKGLPSPRLWSLK